MPRILRGRLESEGHRGRGMLIPISLLRLDKDLWPKRSFWIFQQAELKHFTTLIDVFEHSKMTAIVSDTV